jgi:hypothetical protein
VPWASFCIRCQDAVDRNDLFARAA